MQRPAELVPIRNWSVMVRESSRESYCIFGQNFAKMDLKFSKIMAKLRFANFLAKNEQKKHSPLKRRERCKGVHCVDRSEGFPTNIYLHNLASIQPRTSLVKFARSPRTDPDHYYYYYY